MPELILDGRPLRVKVERDYQVIALRAVGNQLFSAGTATASPMQTAAR